MKNATHETRIRIYIDLCTGSGDYPENITMTAAAWNCTACAFFESAERFRTLGMNASADRSEAIANKIHAMLEMRGYFNE